MFVVGGRGVARGRDATGADEGKGEGGTRGSPLVRHVNVRGATRIAATTCEEGARVDRGRNGRRVDSGKAGGRPGRACFSTKRRRRFFIIAFLI